MKWRFFVLLILFAGTAIAQAPQDVISADDVTRVEKTLSSDDMQGRKVGTPGIEKAADFIIKEFKSAGLQPLPGADSYRQPFSLIEPETMEKSAKLDGEELRPEQIVVFSPSANLTITQVDHYKKVFVKKGDNFSATIFGYFESKENVIVLVDTSFSARFARLARFHSPQFENSGNRIFVLTDKDPSTYELHCTQKISRQQLANIVGVLPGKTLRQEYVIFSAHYDHLGIGTPDAQGDSIFNGANDDASGTTAVIELAKYYSRLKSNERTLIFAAFTAEEIGELGSSYFSKQLEPEHVMAMFNIEMIGTESKWGKNSAYITGFDKTDMGTILQRNLQHTPFTFHPDPYPEQQLFLRSDNATLAKLGVPAHTISTSKMDSEKYYHQRGDEIQTLDMENMTAIIRSIALSAGSIISGKDTPQRVKN